MLGDFNAKCAGYPRRLTRSEWCAARLSTFVLDDESCFTLFVEIVLGTCYAKWAGQPPPTNAQRTVRRASFNFRSLFVDHSADVESCLTCRTTVYRCIDGDDAREYELALGLLSDETSAIDRGLRSAVSA